MPVLDSTEAASLASWVFADGEVVEEEQAARIGVWGGQTLEFLTTATATATNGWAGISLSLNACDGYVVCFTTMRACQG